MLWQNSRSTQPGGVAALLVAAGAGSRMGGQSLPKQFLPVNGIPILAHTLRVFARMPEIERIILVIRAADRPLCERLLQTHPMPQVVQLVHGGAERQDSVWLGLQALPHETEIVAIHDAVRMFVTDALIRASIDAARRYGASVAAVPAKDTIKEVARRDAELFVVKTLERAILWQIQTPQTFQYQLIRQAHADAQHQGVCATDDAMLVEYFGHPVNIVPGSYRNLKITTPDDLIMAEAFWQHAEMQQPSAKE